MEARIRPLRGMRRVCLAILVIALAAAFYTWDLFLREHPGLFRIDRALPVRIDHETCQCIYSGQTRADVVSMIGCPPGDYRTGPTERVHHFRSSQFPIREPHEEWVGDKGVIRVLFDASDQVANAEFEPLQRIAQDPLKRAGPARR